MPILQVPGQEQGTTGSHFFPREISLDLSLPEPAERLEDALLLVRLQDELCFSDIRDDAQQVTSSRG